MADYLNFPTTPEADNRIFQNMCHALEVKPIQPRHRRYSADTIRGLLEQDDQIDGISISEAVRTPGSLAGIANAWGGFDTQTRAALLRECQEQNDMARRSVMEEDNV